MEAKGWTEGFPGTKEKPPGNIPWANSATKTGGTGVLRGDKPLDIPDEPEKLPVEKVYKKLPKHLRDNKHVKASTNFRKKD